MDDLTISDAPIPADQWLRLTVDALKDLGGALQMVPGAKLRQRMVEIGAERKLDVAAHVQASGHPFSRAGRTGRRCCRYPSPRQRYSCRTTRRKHAAMVSKIGEPGAVNCVVTFIEPFTRVVAEPFVYMPHSDKFRHGEHGRRGVDKGIRGFVRCLNRGIDVHLCRRCPGRADTVPRHTESLGQPARRIPKCRGRARKAQPVDSRTSQPDPGSGDPMGHEQSNHAA